MAQLHPETKVLMSGYPDQAVRSKECLTEEDEIMQKPFSLTTLAAKAQQWVRLAIYASSRSRSTTPAPSDEVSNNNGFESEVAGSKGASCELGTLGELVSPNAISA
jgi:hypothetical protein